MSVVKSLVSYSQGFLLTALLYLWLSIELQLQNVFGATDTELAVTSLHFTNGDCLFDADSSDPI